MIFRFKITSSHNENHCNFESTKKRTIFENTWIISNYNENEYRAQATLYFHIIYERIFALESSSLVSLLWITGPLQSSYSVCNWILRARESLEPPINYVNWIKTISLSSTNTVLAASLQQPEQQQQKNINEIIEDCWHQQTLKDRKSFHKPIIHFPWFCVLWRLCMSEPLVTQRDWVSNLFCRLHNLQHKKSYSRTEVDVRHKQRISETVTLGKRRRGGGKFNLLSVLYCIKIVYLLIWFAGHVLTNSITLNLFIRVLIPVIETGSGIDPPTNKRKNVLEFWWRNCRASGSKNDVNLFSSLENVLVSLADVLLLLVKLGITKALYKTTVK